MIVLITGSSSGLGRYTAEEFFKNGHTVYGTSRSEKKSQNGINMIVLDVCDEDSCRNAVDYIIEKEGRIDILVNNAGMGIAGAAEFTSDREAKIQFETNYFGALNMCRTVLPFMRKQKYGRIINVSSVAAAVPIPFQAMYSAGKAALESLSQAMNMEVRPYNIKAVSAQFGDMKTGFTGNRVITVQSEHDSEEVYNRMFRKSLKTMEEDEQKGPEPYKAAKLIYRTALMKNPKPVVTCGFVYKLLVVLRRILPIRLSDMVIRRIYARSE